MSRVSPAVLRSEGLICTIVPWVSDRVWGFSFNLIAEIAFPYAKKNEIFEKALPAYVSVCQKSNSVIKACEKNNTPT